MPRCQSSGSLSHARWCVLACVHNAESPVQCRMLRVAPRVLHVACAAGMAQGHTFAAAWCCKLRLVACGKLAALRARALAQLHELLVRAVQIVLRRTCASHPS